MTAVCISLLREILKYEADDDVDIIIGLDRDGNSDLIARINKFISDHDADQVTYADAIQQARDQYHKDGEIEIDDEALVSPGDDPGIYVSAWVWVSIPNDSSDND